jgi:hypothetical protein
MIHATRKELERGFRFHSTAAGGCVSCSERLLLVYAIECGLKAMIMASQRVEITSALKTQIGHDLREGLKQVGAIHIFKLGNVQTKQKVPQTVEPKQLHETFRYGIHINDDSIVAELKKIMEWIRQRL